MTAGFRLSFAISGALVLAALMLAWLPAQAADTDAGPDPVVTSRNISERSEPEFSVSKTLTREFVNEDGTVLTFPSNTVTVTASETKELRGRQRILISWTGAQPSGGRASNPYGENGLAQEYPVVIVECRGTDDPTLPIEQQVRPETCWTSSVVQRSQITRSESEASWIHDAKATPAAKGRVTGLDPFPAAECSNADVADLYTHLTPFVAASGTVYPACDAAHMPPEAAVGAAFPPAEIAAYSDEEGAGSVQFEVRSDVENESLGCNHKVACTIEVIPINGISCDQPSSPQSSSDTACRRGGQFPPGSSNFANLGVDQAASPVLWWSASNWSNRITIPIGFGLPPDTCDVLDPRPPTGFYGSELMSQASLQWSPAYCLDKKRFKFQLNQMSDDAGWNVMEGGIGAAAFVSSSHKRRGTDPIGYAPTAVTGFAIGYNIDRPDNAGEFDTLRLNPRLVAKLLTQSYLGSDLGRGHPGIGANPLGIMNDPEFIALNPGLSQITQEAGASLLSLSNDSDIIEQLTDWIAHDSAAMDFVNGKADPWGMKVNPSYKKIKLPRAEWPLLDTYIPQTQNTCRQANPDVYFSQLAAPVTTLRKIAEALLDGWPNVQTRCDFDQVSNTYKLGRGDRQSYGTRFMLGLVSLGDLERYGLKAAALQTKKDTYVGPSDASLAAAVDLSQQQPPKKGDKGKGDKGGQGDGGGQDDAGSDSARVGATKKFDPTRPFVLDQADVRKSGKAYPGTMVVYTAAKLRELVQEDADKVAMFIRIATSEGQKAGAGNGELPRGFLPITKNGATRKLYDAAQTVADLIEKQTPLPTEAPAPSETANPTLPPVTGSGDGGVGDAPSGEVPTEAPAPEASPPASTGPAEPIAMPQTEAVSSELGDRAVPTLLILGLLGIAITGAVRFFVRPPRGRGW